MPQALTLDLSCCSSQDRCIVGCAENKIAILLYRLVLTGAFVPNLLTAAQSIAMSFLGPQFYDPPAVRPRPQSHSWPCR